MNETAYGSPETSETVRPGARREMSLLRCGLERLD
jgi:hypothetical protein